MKITSYVPGVSALPVNSSESTVIDAVTFPSLASVADNAALIWSTVKCSEIDAVTVEIPLNTGPTPSTTLIVLDNVPVLPDGSVALTTTSYAPNTVLFDEYVSV